ncbi:terpene cyclase/mutase family protein [Kiritimatiellaeota bacterium B1221]|nr:terpene cyclase/mutase family protein [Kiritimatiellaeota bacterium B1221]
MRKLCSLLVLISLSAFAQRPMTGLQIGREIPAELDEFYRKGLAFLALSQTEQGNWTENYGQQPGVVGFALLAFLASGEDPNYGPYRDVIRKGAGYILSQQNEQTGYIGNSMYNHGFATLALAELYGHLQEPDVGVALQKAVDLILESQEQNPLGGWRYTPISKDADTTVSGAQMVALYAAKNAGLHIPDKAFEQGTKYYSSMTASDGGVGYSGGSQSGNTVRTAISSLVFSLYDDYESETSRKNFKFIRQSRDRNDANYPFYQFYYLSQALFQGDMKEWQLWNKKMIRVFDATQADDGSWNGPRGTTFSTATALLAMALNYRLMPIYER